MTLGETIENIGLVLVVLMVFGLIGICIYHEANIEYKYTADVQCYDKHDSMIEGLDCKHDVYCGPWEESIPFRDGSLPCDKFALGEKEE